MKIKTNLYDSNGSNKEVDFNESVCKGLDKNQLLWVSVLERDRDSVERVFQILKFKNAPTEELLNEQERPKLDKFEDFYRLCVNSVKISRKCEINRVPIDFIVSKNIVATFQSKGSDFFEEFRQLEEGETRIGELDAESFVASMLDLHIVSYFRAVEKIEKEADEFDEKILGSDLDDDDFFPKMMSLRKDVARLRNWLMPHRDVFHALSRPDFEKRAEADSVEHFVRLDQQFESAVNAIETCRNVVLSLFDLYTTRASHKMNSLVKNLTFVTIIFGALSVIVGALGMNFEVWFFKSPSGFWVALIFMGAMVLTMLALAKIRKWI